MSHLCIDCVNCKAVPNGEYLCTKIVIETSIVTGKSTYWQCKDERSAQGACGPDALNFDSLSEYWEKERTDRLEKREAHMKTLSWFGRLLYKMTF